MTEKFPTSDEVPERIAPDEPEAIDADGLPDDLADEPQDAPLTEGPADPEDDQLTAEDKFLPAGFMAADEPVAEDVPDEVVPLILPAPVAAFIRTVVPYLVGWILAAVVWALTPLGVAIPDAFQGWLEAALPVVLGTGYYALAKLLSKRWPDIPWLGSTRQPLYTPPAAGNATFAVAALASTGYVWWKGGRFTPAMRDALVELDRICSAPLVLTQGGFNGTNVGASAGTHAGDAADFSVRGLTRAQVTEIISKAREVGLAAWFRTTRTAKWGTRAHGFGSYHIHLVPNGWGGPSQSAKAQVNSTRAGRPAGYRNGRDGLASNQADTGPGHVDTYRKRTWAGYLSAQRPSAPPGVGGINAIPRHWTAKPWMAIPVDGILSGLTLSRLQWQLNVLPTGRLDHYTIRALKVWLGNEDDGRGILSPLNVTQLQDRVGAYKDGAWGPGTTRDLQRFLNANRG